jgi:hypothetical protein
MKKSLVDLLRADLERDPGDAPVVYVEADVMADDMDRYTPEADEPMSVMEPVRYRFHNGHLVDTDVVYPVAGVPGGLDDFHLWDACLGGGPDLVGEVGP